MSEFISNFMNVVKNNYINFKGRARRKEFWQFFAVVFVISLVLSVLGAILGKIATILAMLVNLALLLPILGLWVRRMQDLGKPFWFFIIPIYNIILAIQEGTKGDNEFGPDPKAGE